METCIFCKIANHEFPTKFVYEDSDVMVFPDIHPVKPVHLLIVPKAHIADLVGVSDDGLFGKLLHVVQKMISEQKLSNAGYRVLVNGGGAQVVDHLHVHLMGPLGKAANIQ